MSLIHGAGHLAIPDATLHYKIHARESLVSRLDPSSILCLGHVAPSLGTIAARTGRVIPKFNEIEMIVIVGCSRTSNGVQYTACKSKGLRFPMFTRFNASRFFLFFFLVTLKERLNTNRPQTLDVLKMNITTTTITTTAFYTPLSCIK